MPLAELREEVKGAIENLKQHGSKAGTTILFNGKVYALLVEKIEGEKYRYTFF